MNDNGPRRGNLPGRFIVMEGGEGVGKTTQWQLVTEHLLAAGHHIVALREPGGTPAGDVLRAVLLDPSSTLAPATEALLFAASRAQLVETVIRPALAEGATVLVDRFLLSTYAYQGAGRGIPIDTLRAINHAATNGVTPDLTLLLTMPLDDALTRVHARGGADRMERETREFHNRVYEAFLRASSAEWAEAHPEIGNVVIVDAAGTPAEVTSRLLSAIAARWPLRSGARPNAPVAMNSNVEVARG